MLVNSSGDVYLYGFPCYHFECLLEDCYRDKARRKTSKIVTLTVECMRHGIGLYKLIERFGWRISTKNPALC